MWKKLLSIAPDLIPIIIQTVLDVENVVTGLKQGQIKKTRVMTIIQSILETKDYFLSRAPGGQAQIINLVSMYVDVTVATMNYTGLFESKEKLDFTPILNKEANQDENDPNSGGV